MHRFVSLVFSPIPLLEGLKWFNFPVIKWDVATTFCNGVDRASATETVDSGSIPGRVKPKTIKIGIHSFPA